MAGSQVAGFTSANLWEIDANTKAGRVSLRSEDFGALGAYSVGGTSAVMAAGLASGSPIAAFRWTDATNLCLVKKITFSAAAGATAFAAGLATFKWFVARSWTVVDTGGSSFLPSGSSNKLRASMGTTLLNSLLISQTATLTAGTRSKDVAPLTATMAGVPAVIGQQLIPPGTPVWERRPGEYPLVLVQNEGIVCEATVPAAGVWGFTMNIDWVEIAAYN